MPSLIHDIRLQVEAAITAGLGPELRGVDPLLRPAADAKFGDYQANVAMSLGKQLGRKPREALSAKVAPDRLDAVRRDLDARIRRIGGAL